MFCLRVVLFGHDSTAANLQKPLLLSKTSYTSFSGSLVAAKQKLVLGKIRRLTAQFSPKYEGSRKKGFLNQVPTLRRKARKKKELESFGC